MVAPPSRASMHDGPTNAWSANESNVGTEGMWDLYAHHRSHVTALLLEQHQRVLVVQPDEDRGSAIWAPRGKLCLLGAGNSNDIDLRKLLRHFETIELVDVDGAALARGTARQLSSEAVAKRVKLHGSIDLLGLDSEDVAFLRDDGPKCEGAPDVDVADGTRAAAALSRGRVAATLAALLSHQCDVVSAMSILPMLVIGLQRHLGFSEMPTGEVAAATRGWDEALDALCESYLNALLSAVRPGGAIVHVSTLVIRPLARSNETFAEAAVLHEHILRGDFFPATNPYAWIATDGRGALHSAALWRGRGARRAGRQSFVGGGKSHAETHPYWIWRSSLTYGVTWLAA